MLRILLPIMPAGLAAPLVRTTVDGGLEPPADHRLDPVNERTVAWAVERRQADDAVALTAIAIGGAEADVALRAAQARGVPELERIDPGAGTLDVVAVARLIAAAARRLGDVAVVALGDESFGGSSGTVPAALAALLGWPLVARARTADLSRDGIVARRVAEDGGRERLSAALPVVLSLSDGGIAPRAPRLAAVIASRGAQVTVRPPASQPDDGPLSRWPTAPLVVEPVPARTVAPRIVPQDEGATAIASLLADADRVPAA